ncbi:MAG: hypothetical protein A2600_06265 [Candidatus Lambdaproteobacteria bacterium RIFOXYD1_FULL_56_27]|uniref:CARDB domain-containing protein n=1 Tax=Candidatus Lambdaproteobacteria bacterium RIFOXYD2_FULL_56_26 TaxID=1817773 RepID=A0A1F6GLF2_9PROT|nr:MAG: hypothetical protein A2557_12935 [Candidatus Lambdaproteobacteria bacterium RIFOXYD2_FULL_56_26]OGH05490.1 MAG: hypothetical protein A2426_03835 [Candidatus Lambdaproteobacteria bacterium RIFOXYC1_FULL_56_13]OGH09781.1 MAG: hypothetical protein A2600_06265 [Candidatus Lambdaproteobacteria bacterium RIFOXYD1_FULL_56_27]
MRNKLRKALWILVALSLLGEVAVWAQEPPATPSPQASQETQEGTEATAEDPAPEAEAEAPAEEGAPAAKAASEPGLPPMEEAPAASTEAAPETGAAAAPAAPTDQKPTANEPAAPVLTGLELEQLLIGEEVINTGLEQLCEVTLRNRSAKDYPVTVRLVVTLPNRNIITFGDKKVVAKGYSDTRALIPYPLGIHEGGDYTVAVRVFDSRDQVVLTTNKLQEQIFYGLDKSERTEPPQKRRKKTLTETELKEIEKKQKAETLKVSKVTFDPPDLKFERVTLVNSSVLRGESTHIRLYVMNDGGNLASNLDYTLYWYFAQRPKRLVNFFKDQIRLIAPGERKILEVPLTIPGSEQQGKYMVVARLDEAGTIKETNENNNEMTSENELIFGDVALVFPDDSYSFAEEGLFQFEWRSKLFNQFKLQISADPAFANEDESFYLPKGDLWTPSDKISPMRGEMPQMAIGLMETKEVDHLYWRVVAKNSQGKVTESQSRRFYINLKPKE